MPDLEIVIGTQLGTAAASTTLTLEELITSMRASGMEDGAIKDVLMSDLTQGGRLFGGYRNQVKNTVKNGMGMVANDSSHATFEEAGVQQYEWIAIGDKSVCIDCERRGGEKGTMEYHKTIGVPRSGFSICQSNCRCKLIPVDYEGEDLDKPLLRGKKQQKAQNPVARSWQEASKLSESVNLSDDSKKLIYNYGDEPGGPYADEPIYKRVNDALRTGKGLSANSGFGDMTVREFVNRLDEVLEKEPLVIYKGTTYRGVRHRSRARYNAFTQNFRNKSHWTNKGFLSTSADSYAAEGFIEELNYSTRVEIKSKTGRSIQGFTPIDEHEVLFSPGKRFEIERFEEIIDLEEGYAQATIVLREL